MKLFELARPKVPVLKESASWCLVASAYAACCQKRRLGMSVLVVRSIFATATALVHTEKLALSVPCRLRLKSDVLAPKHRQHRWRSAQPFFKVGTCATGHFGHQLPKDQLRTCMRSIAGQVNVFSRASRMSPSFSMWVGFHTLSVLWQHGSLGVQAALYISLSQARVAMLPSALPVSEAVDTV